MNNTLDTENRMSISVMKCCTNGTGVTIQAIGRTNNKLKIFEPNTFPTTMLTWFFLTNDNVVTSSGKDVPNATPNKDKKVVETPKKLAVFRRDDISNFELPTKHNNDDKNRTTAVFNDFVGCSVFWTLFFLRM